MSYFDDQLEEWELGGCVGSPEDVDTFDNMAAQAEKEQRKEKKKGKNNDNVTRNK